MVASPRLALFVSEMTLEVLPELTFGNVVNLALVVARLDGADRCEVFSEGTLLGHRAIVRVPYRTCASLLLDHLLGQCVLLSEGLLSEVDGGPGVLGFRLLE